MQQEAAIREPLILGNKSYKDITDDVVGPIQGKAPLGWKIMITISSVIAFYGVGCILYLIGTGIGVWGLNKTVGWAWDITNFVWWVGIGHAGTLISAVLAAVPPEVEDGHQPLSGGHDHFRGHHGGGVPGHSHGPHLGELLGVAPPEPVWLACGSTLTRPCCGTCLPSRRTSRFLLVFWYIGLIPDFATIRDRMTKPLQKKIYGLLSFGWSGRAKHWTRFEEVSLVLAGIATPLVFSVHSIVSMDFATSVIPGWHTTIFPPYFVSGAVFSGFAMVQTLLLIMRKTMNLENYIHTKHVEYMNIVIIVTGSIVGVAYLTELFISWYSGVEYESYAFINRFSGPYSMSYWIMMTCNVVSPQLFWFKKIRRSLVATFALSIVVNIGMWFERYVIIVTSLHRDYRPLILG